MGNALYQRYKKWKWLRRNDLDTTGFDKLLDEIGIVNVYSFLFEPKFYSNEALMYHLMDRALTNDVPRRLFVEMMIYACHENQQLQYFYSLSREADFDVAYHMPSVLYFGNADMLKHLLELQGGAWITWLTLNASLHRYPPWSSSSRSLTFQAIINCSSSECILLLHQYGLKLKAEYLVNFCVTNSHPQTLFEVLSLLVEEPHKLDRRLFVPSVEVIEVLQLFKIRFTKDTVTGLIVDSKWAEAEQVLRYPELIDTTLDFYGVQKCFKRASKPPKYWDDYPLVYGLMKRLYYDHQDWIRDDGGDETVEAYIVKHEARKQAILQLVKQYVKHKDVVDHVLMKYL